MPTKSISPPLPEKVPPYYMTYLSALAGGDILDTLRDQLDHVRRLLGSLDDERASFRYAPGKWSVKQVVGHLVDAERVFALRAMVFSRGEQQPMPGFDEDAYVAAADFDRRALSGLLDELSTVRASTLTLFAGMNAAMFDRGGIANGQSMTVRAFPFVIAGHMQHHLGVLQQRYMDRT